MRFRAHETFSIRKGWLHKGMRHIIDTPNVFTDKLVSPMEKLGLGTNMVKSLRYWLQVTGLTKEEGKKRDQKLTDFGKLVWENDAYFEEDGTLFLIQYLLASNKEDAPSWYYFFNHFNAIEITKEGYLDGIKKFLLDADISVAERSLEDDFECILKMYLPSKGSISPESNMESPFSELHLLETVNSEQRIYIKKSPRFSVINPLIILAVIVNERDRAIKNKTMETDSDVKISQLENSPCNVGKVFNLDAMNISAYLDRLQNMGYIRVIRTAGLDIVKIITSMHFNEIVEQYYTIINS